MIVAAFYRPQSTTNRGGISSQVDADRKLSGVAPDQPYSGTTRSPATDHVRIGRSEDLDLGSRCRTLILRNANVACFCRLFSPMSPVYSKKCPCPMSLYSSSHCHCHYIKACVALSNLSNAHVALSNLRVEGHSSTTGLNRSASHILQRKMPPKSVYTSKQKGEY